MNSITSIFVFLLVMGWISVYIYYKKKGQVFKGLVGHEMKLLGDKKVELIDRINTLKDENRVYAYNKNINIRTSQNLMAQGLKLHNYLMLKQETVSRELEELPEDMLSEEDKEWMEELGKEIQFAYNIIQELNNYHFSVTGQYFVKWEKPNLAHAKAVHIPFGQN